MQSSEQFGTSSDASDDDDDDGGWLSHSNFDLNNPPVSARHHSTERRPLDSSGFDVSAMLFILSCAYVNIQLRMHLNQVMPIMHYQIPSVRVERM